MGVGRRVGVGGRDVRRGVRVAVAVGQVALRVRVRRDGPGGVTGEVDGGRKARQSALEERECCDEHGGKVELHVFSKKSAGWHEAGFCLLKVEGVERARVVAKERRCACRRRTKRENRRKKRSSVYEEEEGRAEEHRYIGRQPGNSI